MAGQLNSVVSAGLLCYAYAENTHDIFFLLGRDRTSHDWPRGSNKWSDFGGCLDDGETEIEGAAREFVEESMGIVPFPQEDLADLRVVPPFMKPEYVGRVLEKKKFTFRVAMDVSDRRGFQVPVDPTQTPRAPVRKLRVCYVKRIPWLPDLPERFDQVRDCIDRIKNLVQDNFMTEAIQYYHSLSMEMQNHPALTIARDQQGKISSLSVNPDFCEKQQIGWWSLHRLRSVLKNGGSYKSKFCFRIGFLSTLAVVIEQLSVMELICAQLMHTRRNYVVDIDDHGSDEEQHADWPFVMEVDDHGSISSSSPPFCQENGPVQPSSAPSTVYYGPAASVREAQIPMLTLNDPALYHASAPPPPERALI